MNYIKGGVCAAKGYKAGATAAGIKYEGRNDMALIISDKPCIVAGVFTKNIVKAAPVKWDMDIMREAKPVHAIVANSGIANAATGKKGYLACEETAKYTADVFGFTPKEVMVASTGVIGFNMPMDKVRLGIDSLKGAVGDSNEFAELASKAIMTTDTYNKEVAVSFDVDGKEIRVGGMAKGSGMIHPNMGTMLCFITSDADIDRTFLQEMLKEVTEDTFNMVSVDGDTSTNDTCLVLANGVSGVKIKEGSKVADKFKEALFCVCKDLSMMLAGDGEGATALVEAKVIHASDKDSARVLAKSVITSSLTKAAIFGHDANWGRIMCALGYSGASFDPEVIDIRLEGDSNSVLLVKNGQATDYSEEEATKVLSAKKVRIVCDIKNGESEACAWGCDLSYDYIKINADYRS